METVRFLFWEVIEVLSLALLGLMGAKAVAGLGQGLGARRALKAALYVAIAVLVALGARTIGYDAAAQLYLSTSRDNIDHTEYVKAYVNALQAVELRPSSLRYWRALTLAKMAVRQFQSAVDDLPAYESLTGGQLDEEDQYDFALCYFYLNEYDRVIALTRKLISENRFYAAPYVVQGLAYAAEKKYRDAELSFLGVLQTFPSHQAAVEGLAHAYFLDGNRSAALNVLDQTARHSFSPEARQRFEALKALYAQ